MEYRAYVMNGAIQNKKALRFALFIFSLLIADQLTKQLTILWVPSGGSIPLFGGLIHLTLAKNQGLIMGLFSAPFYLSVSLTVLLVAVLFFFWFIRLRRKTSVGTAFIIGGVAGNLWDRIFRTGIIDFIDVRIWPVFNLADVFITAGVVLILYNMVFLRAKCTE